MNAYRKLVTVISVLFIVFTLQAAAHSSAHASRCRILADWNERIEFYGAIFAGEVTRSHLINTNRAVVAPASGWHVSVKSGAGEDASGTLTHL
jgi:hypothetical protein